MARSARPLTLVLLIGLVVATCLPDARADLDPPGAPVVTDWLALTELKITRDWGDGGGDAEICLDVRFNHPGHTVEGANADWLKFDCWEDLELGPPSQNQDGKKPPLLQQPYTLVGQGGKVDQWLSPTHRECVPTAAWEFRVRVTEINGTNVGTIIGKVGEALGKDRDPRAAIAGLLLQAVAPLLDQIFGGHDNVGTGQQNWAGSLGDADGTVPRDGVTESFTYHVDKVVVSEKPQPNPNPCGPTPTPTPTGTPTLTPTRSPPSSTPTPTSTPTASPSPSPQAAPARMSAAHLAAPHEPAVTQPLARFAPSAATPVRASASDGYDLQHPFTRSVRAARTSWQRLREAARLVDHVRALERRTTDPPLDVRRQQTLLRELIGTVARFPAATALVEAEHAPGTVSPATLARARQLVTDGDAALRRAILGASTADLLNGIDAFRDAFDLLAPRLYPDFNR